MNETVVVLRGGGRFAALYTLAMNFIIRVAKTGDIPAIRELIAASVRGLQMEYGEAEREAALATVFTVDSRLIADGTYLVAMDGDRMAGCGGWSYRKTLYGGDHQIESAEDGILDAAVDAAKIRAIFVHPDYARKGLGSRLLRAAEDRAAKAGFWKAEMGSTLAGVALYTAKGYRREAVVQVPVGAGLRIEVVRMTKLL
ncbi:GNAT family N-acetyltransferase [Granulicella arctica]|uniref:GNAT family N-acetyltransferase n=1 Tax=Granulicella arctica TaxID=940613 RepID=UPI0021E0CDB7|nr:GNAT family N-acetyltransferase [Granulicella arctica]